MQLIINSRALDQQVTFTRPGRAYIFVDLNGQPGTLGNQICWGGKLTGSTIEYHGDDEGEFKELCRQWFRSYRAARRLDE